MSTVFEIPLAPNVAWFREKIVLDRKSIFLEISFNATRNCWFLDILDAEENPLICSVSMVSGVPLMLDQAYLSELPQGYFILLSDSPKPGFDELKESKMVYISNDSI